MMKTYPLKKDHPKTKMSSNQKEFIEKDNSNLNMIGSQKIVEIHENRSPNKKPNKESLEVDDFDINEKNYVCKSKELSGLLGCMSDNIDSMIKHNIKVSTIVSEICSCRILKDIIFTNHQQRLLPLVEIEMERKRKLNMIELREKSEQMNGEYNKSKVIHQIRSYASSFSELNNSLRILYSRGTKSKGYDNNLEVKENTIKEKAPNFELEEGEIHTGKPDLDYKNDCLTLLRDSIDEFIKENLPEFVKQNIYNIEQVKKDNRKILERAPILNYSEKDGNSDDIKVQDL